MPVRRAPPMLVTLLALTAVSVIAVRAAGGATAVEMVTKAERTYGMQCAIFNASWSCGNWPWSVRFEPETGEVTHVVVYSDEDETDGMGDPAQAMMVDFIDAVCMDASGVSKFVSTVAALTRPGDASPADLARCRLAGGYVTAGCEFGCYWVDAVVHEPPPTSAPTPPASPSPMPSPAATTATPRPGTVTPTPKPTAPPPHASPTLSATASSTSTSTPAGETSSPDATASPSPTQEQGVAGGNPTPSATSDAPALAEPPGPGRFARSVRSVGEVSGDPLAVGGSGLLAILLVLFVAFPGELFNDTVESNFDEIAGWFRRGPLGGLARGLAVLPHGPIAIALFVSIAAFLNALLDPGLGLDLASVATYLGFLVALVVTLIAFDGPPLIVHRRRTGEVGSMRVLPWTLLIVAIFVVVSRVASLQPGYLYGIVLGIVFVREDTPRDEGREQAAGAVWTLGVALAAWLLLGWLRATSPDAGGFATIVAETALAAVLVAGVEAVALGLVPFRFLPGAAIYRWSRPAWAALFGIGIFAFIHVLIGPNVGYLSELSLAGLTAAAAAFVAFAVISVLVWGYFRFRPERAAAGPSASEG